MQTDPLNAEMDLIRHLADGDQRAAQVLYEQYNTRLFRYAIRLTGEAQRAEDVVQESWVAAWRGAAKFRGEGRVLAWLLGIVHHQAMRSYREKPVLPLDQVAERELGVPPQLEEGVTQDERKQAIQYGLAELSLEHRMVLELVFYQGLSLKETAEVCDCPVGTVKSRLRYAKDHLKGVLTRSGVGMEE